MRIGPHFAQLEISLVSRGAREFEWQGWQISHGHGRLRRRWTDTPVGKPAAAQRGWRVRPAHVYPLVAISGAARRQVRLRARLPHRVWRRPPHARHGYRGRARMADRRQLWTTVQERRAPLLRLVCLLRRSRGDDPERTLVLRDRPG